MTVVMQGDRGLLSTHCPIPLTHVVGIKVSCAVMVVDLLANVLSLAQPGRLQLVALLIVVAKEMLPKVHICRWFGLRLLAMATTTM